MASIADQRKGMHMESMEDYNIFISSCSRRELARRRPSRPVPRLQVLMALAVLVTAALVFMLVQGLI